MINAGEFHIQPKSDQEREVERIVQQARSSAIRFIGLGRKASGRVEDHLRREGFEPEVIQQVLVDLQVDHYIDDERLARRQVRGRSGAKAESSSRLAQRMSQSGLDEQAVHSALDELPDDRTLAREALAGRFGRPIQITDEDKHDQYETAVADYSSSSSRQGLEQQLAQRKIRLKMQRFLASRGFSAEITREAIREFWKGYTDNDEDN